MSTSDKLLALRCVPVVAAVRFGLSVFSYETVRRWMPRQAPATATRPEDLPKIAAAIRRAARLVPGASCLTQALAGQFMLARSGHRSQIRIGVARDRNGEFLAHAWLISGDRILIGGSARDVGRFTSLVDLEAGPR